MNRLTEHLHISNNENVVTVVNGVITAGTHTGTAIITITHDSGITSEISLTVTQAGRTATPMVAGGSEFAVALLDNGEVWTWGSNEKDNLATDLQKIQHILYKFHFLKE